MLQLMLILVSPVFISATLYVTLGKFKVAVGEAKRRCGPTSIFIIADVVAFCTQIGGGLVQVTGDLKLMKIGDNVVLGGLIFQLVVLIGYFTLIWRFHNRACSLHLTARWRPFVIMLFVATAAIWIRNLVRAIEFAQGFYGFISQNEALIYVFDSFLMLLVMVLFGVLHPGRLISQLEGTRGQRIYSMEPVNKHGGGTGFV